MAVIRFLASILILLALVPTAQAQWSKLVPFGRTANKPAAPPERIELTENDGPWLILAQTFVGEYGRDKAIELTNELRKTHGMAAFVYRQSVDLDDTVIGLGVDKYGDPKRMKHKNASDYEGYAVLVGNFASVDDPRLEDTLQKIKYMRPDAISGSWV